MNQIILEQISQQLKLLLLEDKYKEIIARAYMYPGEKFPRTQKPEIPESNINSSHPLGGGYISKVAKILKTPAIGAAEPSRKVCPSCKKHVPGCSAPSKGQPCNCEQVALKADQKMCPTCGSAAQQLDPWETGTNVPEGLLNHSHSIYNQMTGQSMSPEEEFMADVHPELTWLQVVGYEPVVSAAGLINPTTGDKKASRPPGVLLRVPLAVLQAGDKARDLTKEFSIVDAYAKTGLTASGKAKKQRKHRVNVGTEADPIWKDQPPPFFEIWVYGSGFKALEFDEEGIPLEFADDPSQDVILEGPLYTKYVGPGSGKSRGYMPQFLLDWFGPQLLPGSPKGEVRNIKAPSLLIKAGQRHDQPVEPQAPQIPQAPPAPKAVPQTPTAPIPAPKNMPQAQAPKTPQKPNTPVQPPEIEDEPIEEAFEQSIAPPLTSDIVDIQKRDDQLIKFADMPEYYDESRTDHKELVNELTPWNLIINWLHDALKTYLPQVVKGGPTEYNIRPISGGGLYGTTPPGVADTGIERDVVFAIEPAITNPDPRLQDLKGQAFLNIVFARVIALAKSAKPIVPRAMSGRDKLGKPVNKSLFSNPRAINVVAGETSKVYEGPGIVDEFGNPKYDPYTDWNVRFETQLLQTGYSSAEQYSSPKTKPSRGVMGQHKVQPGKIERNQGPGEPWIEDPTGPETEPTSKMQGSQVLKQLKVGRSMNKQRADARAGRLSQLQTKRAAERKAARLPPIETDIKYDPAALEQEKIKAGKHQLDQAIYGLAERGLKDPAGVDRRLLRGNKMLYFIALKDYIQRMRIEEIEETPFDDLDLEQVELWVKQIKAYKWDHIRMDFIPFARAFADRISQEENRFKAATNRAPTESELEAMAVTQEEGPATDTPESTAADDAERADIDKSKKDAAKRDAAYEELESLFGNVSHKPSAPEIEPEARSAGSTDDIEFSDDEFDDETPPAKEEGEGETESEEPEEPDLDDYFTKDSGGDVRRKGDWNVE